MSVRPDPFVQFRRLLLGTMVEVLQQSGLPVDLGRLEVGFDEASGFRFLWVDNWMRFKGHVTAPLTGPAAPADVERLRARLHLIWPELLATVATLPLADRLDLTREEITLHVDAHGIDVRFDLEAD